MTEHHELAVRITELFLENIQLDIPDAEMDLFETGLLDSFGLVEMLYQFEVEFDVTIPIDELDFENFNSVNRMADFIASREMVSA